MGVVYLTVDHGSCPYMYLVSVLFYIFNTTPNPTSSSFFQNVFVLVYCNFFKRECMYVCACMHVRTCMCLCVYVSTLVRS